MATLGSRGSRHLGGADGREVVFCHACEYEWYRDEYDSLTCPSCDSTFTEIVSQDGRTPFGRSPADTLRQVDAANDPRGMHNFHTPSDMSSTSGRYVRRPGGSDSDPDEADIEEHVHERPPGFFMHRPFFESPAAARNDRERTVMSEGDAIMRRFADMLMNDLGAGRVARAFPGPGGAFTQEEHVHHPGTRVHQTTFRTGPFGSTHTRVTITSGTMRDSPEASPLNFGTYVSPRRGHHHHGPEAPTVVFVTSNSPGANQPHRLFGQLLGSPLMPAADDPDRRARGGQEPAFGFGGGVHDLLTSLFNPAAAVHGDAVFTQEALDRIITQLMDASPQTNAAPPASQAAIDRLEKKRVDDEMLGPEGKAECTICIEEIKKGEEVLMLPCKHWYHGECVVLWLKEHNTCPICRMPIENRDEEANNGGSNSRQQPQSSATSGSTSSSAPGSAFPSFSPHSSRQRLERGARSPRENAERLNSIRAVADNLGRSDSRSGSQRRNSLSPPGAWPSEDGSRSRVRSPSRDRDRDMYSPYREWEGSRDADYYSSSTRVQNASHQQGGIGGTLSWIRDHFGRAPGPGPDRDRRR